MIGFDINARGSYGFKWSRGAWTEGKMWLGEALKIIPRSPENKGSKHILKGIEKQFEKLGKIYFWNYVVNCGLDLHLTVKGDMNFMYQFQSNKPSDQIAREFLEILKRQKEEMGSTVMLYLGSCFRDFQLHVFNKNLNGLSLVVDIDL